MEYDERLGDLGELDLPEPPRPINWITLTADEAETAWHELDTWVTWLRRTYALPASIIPPAWHRDFADTLERLRDWVTTSGTRLDHDRPTRQTTWPGEDIPREGEGQDIPITDRAADFEAFITADINRRRARPGRPTGR